MKQIDSKKAVAYLMRKIKKEDFKTRFTNNLEYTVQIKSKNEWFLFDIYTQDKAKPNFFVLQLIGIGPNNGLSMEIDLEDSQKEKLTNAIIISRENIAKRNIRNVCQANRRETLRQKKLVLKQIDSVL